MFAQQLAASEYSVLVCVYVWLQNNHDKYVATSPVVTNQLCGCKLKYCFLSMINDMKNHCCVRYVSVFVTVHVYALLQLTWLVDIEHTYPEGNKCNTIDILLLAELIIWS